MKDEEVRNAVREKYGKIALKAGTQSCCGSGGTDPVTADLYDPSQKRELPEKAVQASLGCGNPTALAELRPGETVLDLGSGGGIDVLLSAKRVGPSGKAYGLDMTDEMLALSRENQAKSGLTNVEFLKGDIEAIPLPDAAVDVVISNCVINLSADKDKVLREAYRVLRPGGRFAVSDVVVRGPVPDAIRRDIELWIGCVAGALQETEYRAKLAAAGFRDIVVESTRVYDCAPPEAKDKFASAFIRATKPQRESGRPAARGVDSREAETGARAPAGSPRESIASARNHVDRV